MNKYTYWLLSFRYIQGAAHQKSISTMLIMCFISTFIATCALSLILCIMNGFEQATLKSLQGIHADIIMQAHNQGIDVIALEKLFKKEFPQINSWSPTELQQGLLYPAFNNNTPAVVLIKAIDPKKEAQTTAIVSSLLPSTKNFQNLFSDFSIIIGYKLARNLSLKLGDIATLAIPSDQTNIKNIHLEQASAKVSGFLKTGIEEYDSGLILCSLSFLEKIIPEIGVSFINIKIEPNTNQKTIINQLQARTGLDVYSWQELYPALISALKLEKYTMFFIASLMMLIASISIISLLFMLITAKRGDMAILQAMGMSLRHIKFVFLLIGTGISLISSCLGLITAYIIGYIIQTYQLIPLPDAYFVSHLPVALELRSFLIVFVIVILISLSATYFSIRPAKELTLIKLLRLEA
ncbi:MAG: FtsX-like permease family protein [Candidatus Babeliales bacterium]